MKRSATTSIGLPIAKAAAASSQPGIAQKNGVGSRPPPTVSRTRGRLSAPVGRFTLPFTQSMSVAASETMVEPPHSSPDDTPELDEFDYERSAVAALVGLCGSSAPAAGAPALAKPLMIGGALSSGVARFAMCSSEWDSTASSPTDSPRVIRRKDSAGLLHQPLCYLPWPRGCHRPGARGCQSLTRRSAVHRFLCSRRSTLSMSLSRCAHALWLRVPCAIHLPQPQLG